MRRMAAMVVMELAASASEADEFDWIRPSMLASPQLALPTSYRTNAHLWTVAAPRCAVLDGPTEDTPGTPAVWPTPLSWNRLMCPEVT